MPTKLSRRSLVFASTSWPFQDCFARSTLAITKGSSSG